MLQGAWANEVALMANQCATAACPNRRTAAVIKMEHGAPEWPMLRTIRNQQLYVKPEEPGLHAHALKMRHRPRLWMRNLTNSI